MKRYRSSRHEKEARTRERSQIINTVPVHLAKPAKEHDPEVATPGLSASNPSKSLGSRSVQVCVTDNM